MDINSPWSLSLHDLFKRRNHIISLRCPKHINNDKNGQKRATKRPENIASEELDIIWQEEKKEVKPTCAKPQNNQDFPSQTPVTKTSCKRLPLFSDRESGRRFYNFSLFFIPLVSPLWLISLVACQCIQRNLSDNMELQNTYRNFSSKK